MPFDPTLPQPNTLADADVVRGQLTSLKALIDAQAAQIAALQNSLNSQLAGTARNPNGQFGNFDPNWQPSGNTTDDDIYLRDRLTDLYNALAR